MKQPLASSAASLDIAGMLALHTEFEAGASGTDFRCYTLCSTVICNAGANKIRKVRGIKAQQRNNMRFLLMPRLPSSIELKYMTRKDISQRHPEREAQSPQRALDA